MTDSPRWRCSLCGAEGSEDSPEANQTAAVKHAETHQGFKVGDRVQHKYKTGDEQLLPPIGIVVGVRVDYEIDFGLDRVHYMAKAEDLVSAERRVEDRRKP